MFRQSKEELGTTTAVTTTEGAPRKKQIQNNNNVNAQYNTEMLQLSVIYNISCFRLNAKLPRSSIVF